MSAASSKPTACKAASTWTRKGHIVLDKYPGEWEAMPSYIEEPEAAALQMGFIRERNRDKYDLPTVFRF
jgi:hypothetical protein